MQQTVFFVRKVKKPILQYFQTCDMVCCKINMDKPTEGKSIDEMCGLLRDELYENGYMYGFYLNGKRIIPDTSKGFDEEFARLITTEYRIQTPELSRREKVGTCLDAVLVMKEILSGQGIESKVRMIFQREKKKVHAVLSFELSEKVIYLELTPQSGKPNYGKELIFESEEEFIEYWEQQNYLVQDITEVCKPGANPSFFMDLLK